MGNCICHCGCTSLYESWIQNRAHKVDIAFTHVANPYSRIEPMLRSDVEKFILPSLSQVIERLSISTTRSIDFLLFSIRLMALPWKQPSLYLLQIQRRTLSHPFPLRFSQAVVLLSTSPLNTFFHRHISNHGANSRNLVLSNDQCGSEGAQFYVIRQVPSPHIPKGTKVLPHLEIVST